MGDVDKQLSVTAVIRGIQFSGMTLLEMSEYLARLDAAKLAFAEKAKDAHAAFVAAQQQKHLVDQAQAQIAVNTGLVLQAIEVRASSRRTKER